MLLRRRAATSLACSQLIPGVAWPKRHYGGDTSIDTASARISGEWPGKHDHAFSTRVLKDKLEAGEPIVGCLTNMYGDMSHVEVNLSIITHVLNGTVGYV
jgi:hypothetical protein